jgi:ATP-dependent DNA helicase RecG
MRKSLSLIAGIVLALAGLVTSLARPSVTPRPARAAALTVCPAGPPVCDYTTVQAAVDAAGIQHDLANGLRDVLNVPIAAQVEPLVVSLGGEERVVLNAYIPEAVPYQKPIYVRSQGLDRGCFKRVAGHDMPCTEEDLARFFQERALISADMTPVPLARRADLDPGQVRAFRQLLATQDPANPVLAYDDDDLLRAYGALIQPNGEAAWLPTVAGVLVFGPPELIRRCFPAFRVDLIEIEGTEWVAEPTDRGAGRTFQGPLLEVTREVLRVLRQEIPERFALRPGEAQRMADPMHVALREALHNALMHQDYRIHRPTQVRRFADRLEVENPGASLRDPERLGEPGSELRNPRIAQMFYEIGWAEQKGTGIRAMQQAMEQLGLTPPTFDSDPQDRSFRVTFYRHHFMDEADLAWLEGLRDLALSTEEQKALVYARKTGRVDNAAFRGLSRTDTLTASRTLTRLEGLGLLRRSEQRRGPGVYYTLTEKTTPQVTAQGTPQVTAQSVPQETQALLALLTKGERLSQELMDNLIVTLCAEHPRRARDLAQVLRRSARHLRDTYLSRLVREGRLQLTGSPNDPNVAYAAGTSSANNRSP